ncbi:MAG: hypothetical protein DLM69_07640 [Candidatus Chloroheliales bacterium]|nr:MAG: hypothetical protein DLM69_07640 [Chloroflexota bacterium]
MKETYDLELDGTTYHVERWPAELRGWNVVISGGDLAASIEKLVDNNTLIEDYEFRMMNTIAIGSAEQWAEVVEEMISDA